MHRSQNSTADCQIFPGARLLKLEIITTSLEDAIEAARAAGGRRGRGGGGGIRAMRCARRHIGRAARVGHTVDGPVSAEAVRALVQRMP